MSDLSDQEYVNALVHDIKGDIDNLVRVMAAQTKFPEQVIQSNRPKLTKREVSNIRSLKRSGYTQREISDIYDVNPATVSRIVRHQYHK